MKETKQTIIVKQIHELLNQLECITTNNVTPKLQESLSEHLLRLSCDRYWIYDPLINTVVLHLAHRDNGTEIRITRSLTALQSQVGLSDRLKVNNAFERMLDSTSKKESFSYSVKDNEEYVTYDVIAQCYEIEGHKKIIGTTRIVNKNDCSIETLLQAQQKYNLLFSLSSTSIWQYDVKRKVFSANRTLCEKLQLEEREYSLSELEQHVAIEEIPLFIKQIELHNLCEKSLVHMQNRTNHHTYIFESNSKAVCDKCGEYVMVLGTMNDITEHEMLRTMASKDSLTGCYNRNMADVSLESSFTSFQEHGDFYTIIFFDIDKFKTVNDRYGHDMGDYVLCSVCERIAKEIRSNDMMFRWGGDEFLLICRGIAKENIYGYIDRLRKNIESSTFEFKGTKLNITISIGAAIFYKNDIDFGYAMKRADRSLYKAKIAGRNKVCILN